MYEHSVILNLKPNNTKAFYTQIYTSKLSKTCRSKNVHPRETNSKYKNFLYIISYTNLLIRCIPTVVTYELW